MSLPDDNWPETKRARRRLRAAWKTLWAQVFLGWALRCDRETVVDFMWDVIEDEITARKATTSSPGTNAAP